MVTEYGAGTVISWPNNVVAPPPTGQVIVIGVPVEAAPRAGVGAAGSAPSALPAMTAPTAAPTSATAPRRTANRRFRFTCSVGACRTGRVVPGSAVGERRDRTSAVGRRSPVRDPTPGRAGCRRCDRAPGGEPALAVRLGPAVLSDTACDRWGLARRVGCCRPSPLTAPPLDRAPPWPPIGAVWPTVPRAVNPSRREN